MRKFVDWEEIESKKWYTCHACGKRTDKPLDDHRCPCCKKPLWERWAELARRIPEVKSGKRAD